MARFPNYVNISSNQVIRMDGDFCFYFSVAVYIFVYYENGEISQHGGNIALIRIIYNVNYSIQCCIN